MCQVDESTVTIEEVKRLAELLDEILPVDKDLTGMIDVMVKDGNGPRMIIQDVLGRALNWYKFGN